MLLLYFTLSNVLFFVRSLSADSPDTCEGVKCDPNAECIEFVPSRRRLCVCKEGWQGDGRTCYGMNIINSTAC